MISKTNIRKHVAAPFLLIGNHFANAGSPDITYIVERKNWSIKWDGIQLCEYVSFNSAYKAKVSSWPFISGGKILHFGSQFHWQNWHDVVRGRRKIVVNYFHGKPTDGEVFEKHFNYFIKRFNEIDLVTVPNDLTERLLLDHAVDSSKIIKVPIGVDTNVFKPSEQPSSFFKDKFALPKDKFIIGSFQKDGNGWGRGETPKLIKGPDLFVELVAELNKRLPVFVFLTGPARGYVKERLEADNIPYKHMFFKDYFSIVDAYRALDLYLMTSREEGGPKALLECCATKTPIFSNSVGMAPEVLTGNLNKLLLTGEANFDAEFIANFLSNKDAYKSIGDEMLSRAKDYDWSIIGKNLIENVYNPLLVT